LLFSERFPHDAMPPQRGIQRQNARSPIPPPLPLRRRTSASPRHTIFSRRKRVTR
jgi:hypothetical protein